MKERKDESTPGPDDSGHGEDVELLRELIARDAYALRPSPVPYAAVCRRGRALRQRRVTAVWAAVTALAVVPVGAYAVTGHVKGADTASSAAGDVSSTAAASESPSPPPSPKPSGPARPATAGQLLDGITFEQAAKGLDECISGNNEMERQLKESMAGQSPNVDRPDMSLPADGHYRIILAMRSTGDSNAPGDGYFVVAVRDDVSDPAQQERLICTLKKKPEKGEWPGINRSSSDASGPDAGPVIPDINGGKLYMQSVIDRGHWKLPFRWADIGTVDPSVARVTVSYGGRTHEAALDHGWFVASGILEHQVTVAPRIKGYDGSGALVYDSDRDKGYARTLP